MTIDINKQYHTKSGLPVRIYATDGTRNTVHGAVFIKDSGWSSVTWNHNGTYPLDASFELVELPQFKVGDYVRFKDNNKVFQLEKRHLTTTLYQVVNPWESIKDEWCLFWDNDKLFWDNDKLFCLLNKSSGKRRGSSYIDIDGVCWDNCIPYLQPLPPHLQS